MVKFCTACGKEISESAAFCTECGAKAPADIPAEVKQQPVPQQPAYQPSPQQVYTAPPAKTDGSGEVVSTGTFFGTIFLFKIPIIGFLACIIMCFAPKKKSLKNYAKAHLIWAIIGLVIGVLLIIGLIALGNSILNYIKEAINSGLGDLSGLQ